MSPQSNVPVHAFCVRDTFNYYLSRLRNQVIEFTICFNKKGKKFAKFNNAYIKNKDKKT